MLSTTKQLHYLAASTAFLFALFCLCLITGGPTFSNSDSASATSTDLSFTSEPVLSLNVSGDLNFSISSSDFNKFLSKNLVANAASNNETGYTLTLSNDDEDLDLHETSDATDQVISALTEPITITTGGSNFPANQWGYSLNSTDYTAIPANTSAAVLATPDVAGSTSSTINVATKVGDTFPGGTYQDTVVISLTAKPVTRIPKSLEKMTTLQQMAEYPELCTTAATGTTVTLEDTRDGNSYRVRKLKDGNCWMIDSLRLAGVEIENTQSDYSSDTPFTLPAATTETSGASYDSATVRQNTGDYASDGYLYNWFAATAGEGTQSKSSGDVSRSICPKGWKLPSGGGSSVNQSFAKLYAQSEYNTPAKMQDKTINGPEFTLTGRWYNGYGYQGSYGYYWSRTADGSDNAYYLYLDSSSVNPQGSINKDGGRSVRCVSDNYRPDSLAGIDYLQDLAKYPNLCSEAATGTTVLAADSRDGENYRIRKLDDGNCWMIDNLRLGTASQALTLTSADTDMEGSEIISGSNIVSSGTTSWSSDTSTSRHIFVRKDATYGGTKTAPTVSGNNYGNLYTWWTATLGSQTSGTQNDTASMSICPKGWHLPDSGTSVTGKGSFYYLYNTHYNTYAKMTSESNNGPGFKLAGYYNGGVGVEGSRGYYWSRTVNSSTNSYSLDLDGNNSLVGPQDRNYKYGGRSVRCIAS